MYSLLLAIIYLAFISLGLPDSLLGSAWPVMHGELGVSVSYMGILSMIISGGTIISSLMSDRITRKLGAGMVTAISVLMTAVALFGFSLSHSFWLLCLFAIPYGLGAGSVDAALNNYIALHYTSRHMSWLHCFWGVGVSISPYIMGAALSSGAGWNAGYRTVSLLQIILTAILFCSLPLWKKRVSETGEPDNSPALTLGQSLRIPGVKYLLLAFLTYSAVESTTGLWASSYLVMAKGIDVETAARYASLYYLGITGGRFLSGFVADHFGDKNMIRIGLGVMALGILAVCIPVDVIALAGLVIIGFGCAPVYPSIIHATPTNFGPENSQAIVGIQMASAYCGSTFLPPIFGLIAEHVDVALYPVYLGIFAILTVLMTEGLNRLKK